VHLFPSLAEYKLFTAQGIGLVSTNGMTKPYNRYYQS